MFCKTCGAKLAESDLSCPNCNNCVKQSANYAAEENTKLFSTKGRISRLTFWSVFGLCFAALLLGIIPIIGGIIIKLISIPIFLITTSAIIKRLQDMNQSAWFIMLLLIPILGFLVLLIWCGFIKGTDGTNQYGNKPLQDV